MEPKDIVRRRPGAKQAVRIRRDGQIDAASADATVSTDEILRLREAFSAIGAKLALGQEQALSCTDGKQAALFVLETAEATFAVVEPGAGDIDKRAHEVHHLIDPSDEGVVVRRHGILEIRR